MNIFTRLNMVIQKRKFHRQFRPLGLKKRKEFLVSLPGDTDAVMPALSLLGALKKWGRMTVLIPECMNHIYHWLPDKYYTKIRYPKPVRRFGKEKKLLQQQLRDHTIHIIIELNTPVNITIPLLAPAERRICFFDMKNYPYYNIMMKNGFTSLHEFFDVKQVNPAKVIRFTGKRKPQVRAAYGKRRPLCFLNGNKPEDWNGDRVTLGEDIPFASPEALCLLYCSDAYSGKHDIFYDFARAFKKKIIK